jgi:hypothetical protein
MTHEAEKHGWEIAAQLKARRGDVVFHGTADELAARIEEHARADAIAAEQRENARHYPITRLVKALYRFAREHDRYWVKYLSHKDDAHAFTRLKALDDANAQIKRLNETYLEVLQQPKELLLANPDFRELQERLRAA